MKTLGVKQYHQMTYKFIDLGDNAFAAILGELVEGAVISITGDKGNGKTECVVQLCDTLCNAGQKVDYIQYEQGHGADFQMATKRNKMERHVGLFNIIDPREDVPDGVSLFEDIKSRYVLPTGKKRRNTANWIVIDSWDDTPFKYADYKDLKQAINSKKSKTGLIIVTRSSKSGIIKKTVCEDVAFDGQMLLWVSKFIATPVKNRLGGTAPYVIYEKEAKERNPAYFAKIEKDQERTDRKAENERIKAEKKAAREAKAASKKANKPHHQAEPLAELSEIHDQVKKVVKS